MILEGSRYMNAQLLQVQTASGDTRVAAYYPRTANIQNFAFRLYVTVFGDRYDVLAQREYGDHRLWWRIARANPELLYPDDIPTGTLIRIPYASSIR